MRTLVGVFLALSLVSGDEAVTTITGDLKGSVLLPCPCSHRNLDKEFRWQKERQTPILVVKYPKNQSSGDDTYLGRVKVFLHKNSSDCSVLLANLTAEDQGMYRCSFYKEERHSKKFVYLNITARYRVCQTNAPNFQFFQCNASGWHKDAVIEWMSDGQKLADSAKTRITHSNTVEAPSGLYHLISNLTTKLPSTPTCDVKAIDLPAVVHRECLPEDGKGHLQYKGNEEPFTGPEETKRYRYIKFIPFILALVLFLVLWRRWRVSQG